MTPLHQTPLHPEQANSLAHSDPTSALCPSYFLAISQTFSTSSGLVGAAPKCSAPRVGSLRSLGYAQKPSAASVMGHVWRVSFSCSKGNGGGVSLTCARALEAWIKDFIAPLHQTPLHPEQANSLAHSDPTSALCPSYFLAISQTFSTSSGLVGAAPKCSAPRVGSLRSLGYAQKPSAASVMGHVWRVSFSCSKGNGGGVSLTCARALEAWIKDFIAPLHQTPLHPEQTDSFAHSDPTSALCPSYFLAISQTFSTSSGLVGAAPKCSAPRVGSLRSLGYAQKPSAASVMGHVWRVSFSCSKGNGGGVSLTCARALEAWIKDFIAPLHQTPLHPEQTDSFAHSDPTSALCPSYFLAISQTFSTSSGLVGAAPKCSAPRVGSLRSLGYAQKPSAASVMGHVWRVSFSCSKGNGGGVSLTCARALEAWIKDFIAPLHQTPLHPEQTDSFAHSDPTSALCPSYFLAISQTFSTSSGLVGAAPKCSAPRVGSLRSLGYAQKPSAASVMGHVWRVSFSCAKGNGGGLSLSVCLIWVFTLCFCAKAVTVPLHQTPLHFPHVSSVAHSVPISAMCPSYFLAISQTSEASSGVAPSRSAPKRGSLRSLGYAQKPLAASVIGHDCAASSSFAKG